MNANCTPSTPRQSPLFNYFIRDRHEDGSTRFLILLLDTVVGWNIQAGCMPTRLHACCPTAVLMAQLLLVNTLKVHLPMNPPTAPNYGVPLLTRGLDRSLEARQSSRTSSPSWIYLLAADDLGEELCRLKNFFPAPIFSVFLFWMLSGPRGPRDWQ